jgi:hypothetical protein
MSSSIEDCLERLSSVLGTGMSSGMISSSISLEWETLLWGCFFYITASLLDFFGGSGFCWILAAALSFDVALVSRPLL